MRSQSTGGAETPQRKMVMLSAGDATSEQKSKLLSLYKHSELPAEPVWNCVTIASPWEVAWMCRQHSAWCLCVDGTAQLRVFLIQRYPSYEELLINHQMPRGGKL